MNTFNGNEQQVNEIASILKNISESDLLTLNNDYCDNHSYMEDYIYSMSEFDDLMSCKTPTEILECVKSDFSIYDEYFRDTMYGLESGNIIENLMQHDFDDLAEYLIKNGDVNDILADNEDTIKMEFINYATSVVDDNELNINLEDFETYIDDNITSEVYTERWEDLVEQVIEDVQSEMEEDEE